LPFHEPQMKLFSGAATAIVRSAKEPGMLKLTVSASGVRPASIQVSVK